MSTHEEKIPLKSNLNLYAPCNTVPYKNPVFPIAVDTKRGETKEQLEHMSRIVHQTVDTSRDSPWLVHKISWTDYYSGGVVLIFVIPKLLIILPILILFLIPPTATNYYFFRSLPKPIPMISRESFSWKLHVLVQWFLSLPAQILIMINLAFDILAMTILGIIYCILSCKCGNIKNNFKYLRPYQSGPNLYLHFSDCVVACGGMQLRRGYWRFLKSFSVGFLLTPWVKYWLTANPYTMDLGERFITQIGESMADMELKDIDKNFQRVISWTQPREIDDTSLDRATFVPHYPFPPPGRQYAIGMQQSNNLSMFVHTTHFRAPGDPCYTLSKSCVLPVYRVMLWRNNPFHVYTGHVEAGISNGQPCQKDKLHGAEHPMWLINGHSKLAAYRGQHASVGWIDSFFDQFLPEFQRKIRKLVKGEKAAEDQFKLDMSGIQVQREKKIEQEKNAILESVSIPPDVRRAESLKEAAAQTRLPEGKM